MPVYDTGKTLLSLTGGRHQAYRWSDGSQSLFSNGQYTSAGSVGLVERKIMGRGDAMEFVNSYTRSYGDLTIRKTVIGDGSDSSQEFTFVVELDAEGEFKYDGDRSGTVRNGGTIVQW